MATIGVKIELEGTKEYQQGMKNCKEQTKLFDTQLKNLNQNFKGSAFQKAIKENELLKGKMQALAKESELLSTRIQEASDKFGENDTRTLQLKNQYEKLQIEISKTNDALENNGGKFGAIGAQLDEIGTKADLMGQKISGAGETLTKNLTGPIVALGAASIVAFNEVDGGLDTIIKKTGASGEALEEMEDIANNIATSIPTSFDEVGSAVGEVNTRFGSTGDELEDLSKKFIEFAQLNDLDVSSSIDSVQSAMAAFGLSVEDASLFMDALNKAGQDTGVNVQQLASDMTSNAAVLKEFGYSASDSAFFIANLNKQGIDSSTVLAGMKKAMANSIQEGKSMDEALADLDSTMSNASSSTEAYEAAMELFGNKAGPAIAEAVASGRLSFKKLDTELTDFAGNVEDTFDATLDPIDKFDTSMNKLKISGTKLVNASGPLITKFFDKLTDTIDKLTERWDSLSTVEQENVVKIGLVVAAIGPLLVGTGKVVSSINSITTAAKGFATFAAANPVLAGITVAVGLAATAFVTAKVAADNYYHSIADLDEVQQEAYDSAKNYNDQIQNMIDNNESIVTGIDNQYKAEKDLTEELKSIVDENGKVKAGYEERAAVIAGQLAEAFGIEITYQDGVIEKYGEVMDTIDQLISKKKAEALIDANQQEYVNALKEQKELYEDMKKTEDDLAQATSDYQKALEKQKKAEEDLNYAQSIGLASAGGLQIAYAQAVQETAAYKENVDNLTESLSAQQEAFYSSQALIQNMDNLQQALAEGTMNLDEAIAALQTNMVKDAPITFLRQQAADAKQYYEDILHDYESGEVEISEQQIEIAKQNSELANKYLEEAVAEAQAKGGEYADAIAQGMTDSQGNVVVSAQDLVGAAYNGLGTDAEGNAANTTFHALGLDYSTEFGSGITEGQEGAQEAASDVTKAVTGELDDLPEEAHTWGFDLIGNLISGINENLPSLTSTVANIATAIAEQLHFSVPDKGPLSTADEWMPDFMKLLAEGIDSNKYLIDTSVKGLSLDIANSMMDVLDPNEFYDAVRDGASNANINLSIGERDFIRVLREMGVSFN